GAADASYAVEGVVERHVLLVALSSRVGQGMAADAQGGEADLGHGTGGPGVPHGGQDQRAAGVVEVEERAGAGGGVGSGHAKQAATDPGRCASVADVPTGVRGSG